MSRTTIFTGLAALMAFTALPATSPVAAQEESVQVPQDRQAKKLPRQRLAGPRFGFTVFTGEVADLRNQAGLEPIMTQFGWQFETQIVSLTGGNQALMEWVFLLGGMEQSELTGSLAWMTGYRLANGLELGVGPNVSVSKDNEDITTSMVVAGGATLPFGDLYVPVNMAVALAEGGPRITALLGWIVG
jgi:hypothetical protein